MRITKTILRICLYIIAASLVSLGLSRLIVEIVAGSRMFKPEDTPQGRAAIVFGAGLNRDGSPSPILRDRIATAADLYFSGKVEVLLMSGDNRFIEYNEPAAMKAYAERLGVPTEAIVLDFAGRRTYDTCYRARYIFGLTEAILVTQRFHLSRAVFTCQQLGVHPTGTLADRREINRRSMLRWSIRETFASAAALWDVWLRHPLPVLGDPEPIFPLEHTSQRR